MNTSGESTSSPASGLRERRLAGRISLAVSITLFVAKFYAWRVTRSSAVLSDALESIINIVAATVALFVLAYSSKPADEDHPYGHGKLEYFSAALEGSLILIAGGVIVFEAVQTFMTGVKLRELDTGLMIVLVAGFVNAGLGLYLRAMGRRHHSSALVASGEHVLSDFWTSAGVIVGLLLVKLTGVDLLDPITAAIVGLNLAWSGFKVFRRSAGGLMDEEDRGVIETLGTLFTRHSVPGIIRIHHARVIRSGRFHHVDAHVVVPEFWSVAEAHDRVKAFEVNVMRDYTVEGEINFHLDPCERAYCSKCDYPNCPVRRHEFVERIPFTLEELVSPEELPKYRDRDASGE